MDNSHLRGIKNDIFRNLILDVDLMHPGAPLSLAIKELATKNPYNMYFIEDDNNWRCVDFVMVIRWDDGKRYTVRLEVMPQTVSALITACKKALNSSKTGEYLFPMPD